MAILDAIEYMNVKYYTVHRQLPHSVRIDALAWQRILEKSEHAQTG